MLDEQAIRRQLSDVLDRLAHLDDERAALEDIASGYRKLLRARGEPDQGNTGSITFLPSVDRQPSGVVGQIPFRSTVHQVLRDAKGTPLHSAAILEAVRHLGAGTRAKNPLSMVDLVVTGLVKQGKAEKVAPRTWRWIAK